MINLLSRFTRDNKGATAVEYALIAAMIGVVIISGAGALGSALNTKFKNAATSVANAGSAS